MTKYIHKMDLNSFLADDDSNLGVSIGQRHRHDADDTYYVRTKGGHLAVPCEDEDPASDGAKSFDTEDEAREFLISKGFVPCETV